MADIDLLFGVAGGGDVAGESGSLIKSQLESIIKGIEPLKVKVGIDVEASKKEFATEVESLFKGASKSIKLKLDTNGIGKQLSDGAVDKSIKKAALSFEKAESIANNYYSTLREINEANKNGLVIDIQSDGSVRALSKEFEDLAERSNRAQKEMNELKRSVYSLPDDQKAKIQEMLKVADGDYLSNMYPTAAAEKQIKGVTDELKEQVYTFKEAESIIKDYSKIISDVTKHNADIEWDTTYEKYVSKSGAFAEHADSLNRIEAAYTGVVDAMDSMGMEDQIRLQKLLTNEREQFNIALEASAGKERSSFEYSDSVRAVKDYYKMLTKLEKDQEAKKHVALQDNGYWAHNEKGELEWLSKYEYVSDTKDYEELASALNRTKTAFDAVVEARANLLGGQQAKLQTLMTQEAQKYNLVVEDQANKVRVAAEAKREKSESQAAIKAEAEAYDTAITNLKEYYKARTEALKYRDEISLNEDGTWETENRNLDAFVERLNSVTAAYNLSVDAAEKLSAKNKGLFDAARTKEVQAYNEAVQAQNRKDIDANAAKKEADLKRYAAQVEKVNNLLFKTKKQLADWSAAKTGKSSEAYRGLEQTCNVLEEMSAELREAGTAVDGLDSKFDEVSSSAKNFASTIELAGENTKSIKSVLGNLMSTLGISFTFADAFQKAIEIGRKMFETVTEVDTAMTELKKVTEEADSTYTRFLENAKSRAHGLGATVADTVSATADFARLGHTLTDATSLADAAIVYKNVGDGIEDISVASESIISTMQAFGIEAKDAMSIVDSFNNVGNNFAISSKGIGDALLNSAASLHAAGNDIHESIALIAAANTTIQDPGKVGKCLPNNAVMHCKKIAISVKGRRRFRPRKDFVVYIRRVRESTDFYYL